MADIIEKNLYDFNKFLIKRNNEIENKAKELLNVISINNTLPYSLEDIWNLIYSAESILKRKSIQVCLPNYNICQCEKDSPYYDKCNDGVPCIYSLYNKECKKCLYKDKKE